MAKIKDFLHPIWRSALSKYGNKENIDFLGALQKPLDDTETDILNNKVQLYLASAQAHWLDYWGTWLGLRRKKSEEDNTFRNRMINHVLHSRNTVKSIKKAIADFIQTNEDNIYIYEPFRDMLYWNSGDCYNTLKYFPSSYYNYAIIDVHIDASFPPEVVEIINLFRPAGVIWVLTDDVNGVDPTVEPIDFTIKSYNAIDDELWDYAGFYQRETYRLTSYYNDNEITSTPFIWNSSSWNSGNVYYRGANKFDTVVTIGQLYQDYTPLATDDYEATRVYSDQRNIEENSTISNYGTNGVAFTLQPNKDNLVTSNIFSSITNGNSVNSNVTGLTSDSQYQLQLKGSLDTDVTGSLNLQVLGTHNSAVGNNLLTGTSSTINSASSTGYNSGTKASNGSSISVVVGSTYTYRVYISDCSVDAVANVNFYSSNNTYVNTKVGSVVKANSSGYSSITFTIPENIVSIEVDPIRFPSNETTSISYSWKEEKLELGSTYTDWCPNTSDSDYYPFYVITTSLSTIPTKYDYLISIPEWIAPSGVSLSFVSDQTATFSYSYLSIRNYDDNTPVHYSLNATQNYTEQGITCIYDVKQFLMRFTTHAVSQLSPTYIDNLFENKNFVITAKVPSLLNQSLGFTPYIYNFNLSIWVKLDKINFSSSYTSQNININSIVQYLNNNCLLFIKLIPDSILPISINYVGLTLANNDSISSPVLSDSQSDVSVTTE